MPSPENFFNEFVADLEFLGKPINAPIHKHLAERLRTVEREFADKFGGPDKGPKVAQAQEGRPEGSAARDSRVEDSSSGAATSLRTPAASTRG